MCQLLVEAMEAGGCGWSSQILGDIGNMQRDFDGTPMVTDQMTEREVVAFSRALGAIGRGATQITGPLETAAIIARESGRPIIWNALARRRALNQHGEMRVPAPRRDGAPRQLNEEEGVRVFAQAQHRPIRLGDHASRTTTSSTSSRPGGKRASARSRRRSPSSPIPSGARV